MSMDLGYLRRGSKVNQFYSKFRTLWDEVWVQYYEVHGSETPTTSTKGGGGRNTTASLNSVQIKQSLDN